MQILWPQPRPTEPGTLGTGPALGIPAPPGDPNVDSISPGRRERAGHSLSLPTALPPGTRKLQNFSKPRAEQDQAKHISKGGEEQLESRRKSVPAGGALHRMHF